MKRYFIIGTDTDCGKTYVTGCLVNFFSKAAAIKPIASGCIEVGQELVSTDAQQLQKSCQLSLDLINPWRFKLPCSPHIAAKEEGRFLSAAEIAEYCMKLQIKDTEHLFIEGAGGLFVPLNEEETWVDFLKLTGFPVILVVGMKLGCINHALLTQTALEVHRIPFLGWIANCLDPEMLMLTSNIETLKSKLKVPLLATLPYGGGLDSLPLS
jgi:dethiobiotin synthetase